MKFKKVSLGLFIYLFCIYIVAASFCTMVIGNSIVYIYVYYKTGVFNCSLKDFFEAAKVGFVVGGFIGSCVWIAAKVGEKKPTDLDTNNDVDNLLYLCPCCGNKVLPRQGKKDICLICGWIDDPLQSLDPDYSNGLNNISLVDAQKKYFNKE